MSYSNSNWYRYICFININVETHLYFLVKKIETQDFYSMTFGSENTGIQSSNLNIKYLDGKNTIFEMLTTYF